MALENRGNRCYYYRKKRAGGKVISEYVGSGDVAQLASALDQIDINRREAARAARAALRKQQDAIDLEIADLGDAIRLAISATLLAAGYHSHKGQWRRKRD